MIKKLPHWVVNDNRPAFYDTESATAIEQTAKLYGAMSEVIDEVNKKIEEFMRLQLRVEDIEKWLMHLDTEGFEEIIKKYIATMIFVEIDESGYITYHIPENWKDIQFNTTNLDIELEQYDEYGRLVLSY